MPARAFSVSNAHQIVLQSISPVLSLSAYWVLMQASLCELSQCHEVSDSMMQQVDSAALVFTPMNGVTVFRIYIH